MYIFGKYHLTIIYLYGIDITAGFPTVLAGPELWEDRLGDVGLDDVAGLCGDTAWPWLPYEGEGRLLKLTGGAVEGFGFDGCTGWCLAVTEGCGLRITVVFFRLIWGPLGLYSLVLLNKQFTIKPFQIEPPQAITILKIFSQQF
jgi:hypothetical protein